MILPAVSTECACLLAKGGGAACGGVGGFLSFEDKDFSSGASIQSAAIELTSTRSFRMEAP